jgi:hypothetical protein
MKDNKFDLKLVQTLVIGIVAIAILYASVIAYQSKLQLDTSKIIAISASHNHGSYDTSCANDETGTMVCRFIVK